MEMNDQNETVFRGRELLLFDWMSARANFTYTLVQTEYTGFNNFPAVFNSNRLDCHEGNIVLVHGRNHIAHHLVVIHSNSIDVIIPYPKKEANVYSVVLPYTNSVWACVFASMIVMSFLLRCFARAKKYVHRHQEQDPFLTYGGAIFYVVGVATNQGAACFSKARTVKFLAGIWCLAALVIVNAYSSSLITYMTNPQVTPLIKSLQDIVNKSTPQILTTEDDYFQMAVETIPSYQAYRDNTLKVPKELCGTVVDEMRVEQCLAMVKDGGHVLVLDTGTAKYYLDKDFRKTGSCSCTLAAESIPIFFGGWVIPLNSPHELRNALDVLLLESLSTGLHEHLNEVSYGDNCFIYKTVDRSTRKLSLTDFASAFIILGSGTVISLTVFAYEVLRGHLLPKASKKIRTPTNRVK